MIKVKYTDTIEPQEFIEEFETIEEACEWIDKEMTVWHDVLFEQYPCDMYNKVLKIILFCKRGMV